MNSEERKKRSETKTEPSHIEQRDGGTAIENGSRANRSGAKQESERKKYERQTIDKHKMNDAEKVWNKE